ncbi:hypothetical protein ACJMK2_009305 [Sinanodonta woodiana]|uniref:Uncharacterized protein n=1 Tax=Sinanodonta woodiana TaxID=1069815 RepID=A0ABD3VBU4_SINWO
MDFRQIISLLLLILYVVPLKSESPDDDDEQENEDTDHNNSATVTTTYATPVSQTEPTTTTTTRLDGMGMAQSGQDAEKDGHRENDIAVMVGVPVILLGLVVVIGIIRLVSSGQSKNLVLRLRGIFGTNPEKSSSIYTANGSSSQNRTNEMFANRTYEVQSNHGSLQSERMPQSGYGHDNIGYGRFIYDNTEMLKNESDSTYQTIDDAQFNPSFSALVGSNV